MDITAQEPAGDPREERPASAQETSPPPPLPIQEDSKLSPGQALPEEVDDSIRKPEGNSSSSNHEWQAQKWEEKYQEVKEYKELNDTCNVPQSFGALGRWVDRQRVSGAFRESNHKHNILITHNNRTLRYFTARVKCPRHALMPSTSWASSGRLKAGCQIGKIGSAS